MSKLPSRSTKPIYCPHGRHVMGGEQNYCCKAADNLEAARQTRLTREADALRNERSAAKYQRTVKKLAENHVPRMPKPKVQHTYRPRYCKGIGCTKELQWSNHNERCRDCTEKRARAKSFVDQSCSPVEEQDHSHVTPRRLLIGTAIILGTIAAARLIAAWHA